jgi:hypothetical protein
MLPEMRRKKPAIEAQAFSVALLQAAAATAPDRWSVLPFWTLSAPTNPCLLFTGTTLQVVTRPRK